MVMVVLSPRSRRNPVPFHDRTLRSGFASLFPFSWVGGAPWALPSPPCSRPPPQLMGAAVWEVLPATNWLVGLMLMSLVLPLGRIVWKGPGGPSAAPPPAAAG